MLVTNGASRYRVAKKVGDASMSRLYLCEAEDTGRQCLLQIANGLEANGALDRAAYVLRELARSSDAIEAANDSAGARRLQYELLFPELIDSFICQEQGKRRVNVLAFREVENISDMVPLSNLAAKDGLRIDLRTSAWIMGRLLKLLTLVHREGMAARLLSGRNILLEPGRHFAVVFDWSSVLLYPGEVPREERTDDISQAARAVVSALGGSLETGIPDVDGESREYGDYLLRLAQGRESNAERADHKFYGLVDRLWKREYYPFTTLPL